MGQGAAYLWSQVLTVIEYTLLGASYLAKRRRLVVILDILSMTAGIFAFILLGADLGMAMSVIILLANFYYLAQESRGKKTRERYRVRDYVVLAVVLLAIGVVAVLTYDGPLSLLSVAATVLYEISIWQKSTKTYKLLGIPVAFCWMTYNGFVRSIAGVVFEAIMLVTSIIGYVREVRTGQRMKISSRTKKAPSRAKKAQKK